MAELVVPAIEVASMCGRRHGMGMDDAPHHGNGIAAVEGAPSCQALLEDGTESEQVRPPVDGPLLHLLRRHVPSGAQ